MSKEKHAEKKHAHRKGDGKHQSKTPKAGCHEAADGGAQYAHWPARRLVQPAARRASRDQSHGAETARARSGLVAGHAGQSAERCLQAPEPPIPRRGRARLGQASAHRRDRLRGGKRLCLYGRLARRAQAAAFLGSVSCG